MEISYRSSKNTLSDMPGHRINSRYSTVTL